MMTKVYQSGKLVETSIETQHFNGVEYHVQFRDEYWQYRIAPKPGEERQWFSHHNLDDCLAAAEQHCDAVADLRIELELWRRGV